MSDGLYRRVSVTATSWPFVASVLVLLVNDLWLKAAYSNWLTGKLSDFAGIFLVSLVMFRAFTRAPWGVAAQIAAGFALWKSPLSQPLIDLANAWGLAPFGRTVDYSDLVALLSMPPAHAVAGSVDRYQLVPRRLASRLAPTFRRALSVATVALAVLAVMGTTIATYGGNYLIRKTEGTAALDAKLAAQVIAEVAKKNRLECIACDQVTESAEYRGRGIWMRYEIRQPRTITFSIIGRPWFFDFMSSDGDFRKRVDVLLENLKTELGKRVPDVEFVIPLPEQRY